MVLCLAGWQQKHDALANLVPDAIHFNYALYHDMEKMFSALPARTDMAIGWSLGGQLLVRAMMAGYIRPKKLILAGTAFQLIADDYFVYGTKKEDFTILKADYIADAEKFLHYFNMLIAYGDKNAASIRKTLNKDIMIEKNGLFWLEELEKTSFRGNDFSGFPPTLILHGEKDRVVHPANARKFAEQIPNSTLCLLPEYGHLLPIDRYLYRMEG